MQNLVILYIRVLFKYNLFNKKLFYFFIELKREAYKIIKIIVTG